MDIRITLRAIATCDYTVTPISKDAETKHLLTLTQHFLRKV